MLIAHAEAYFQWCDDHPYYRVELVKYKGDFEHAEVPMQRPYTIIGLCNYLGVSARYFTGARQAIDARRAEDRATILDEALYETYEMIEGFIKDQQIGGAMVGIFKEGIVARLNGLAETIKTDTPADNLVRVVVRDQETKNNLDNLKQLL